MTNMKVRTFVKKLQQNQITDFDEFLTPAYPMSFRRELVKRGIRVEDAVALNESQPIREAILQGYLPEKYTEWKNFKHEEVRQALATSETKLCKTLSKTILNYVNKLPYTTLQQQSKQ